MHYSVCFRLESFYARELARLHPNLEGESFVVVDSGLVLDASDDAAARGVTCGMPMNQAKALLSSTRFIERNREELIPAQRAWLDVLTPFTDVIEPIEQHEAVIDLSAHPRPQEMASLAIHALTGYAPRVLSGFGESKWIARLALEYGRLSDDPLSFLAPLPVAALSLLSPESREKLLLLGYRDVGSLHELPLQVLCRQFPEEGLMIHRLAHAQHFEPVQALYPDRSIGGLFPFEGGTDSLETIGAGYAQLAKSVGGKLLAQEQETSELLLHIEYESGMRSYERSFSKPIRNELSLLASLRLLVEGLHAEGILGEESVYSLRVTLPHLKRAKRMQNGLFTQRADTERKLGQAVATVQNVFGHSSIHTGAEIVLPRRIRVLKEMGSLVGWR